MNIVTVYKLIECRRNELNKLVNIYGMKDQRVMAKSVQLDRIINMYIHKKLQQLPLQHTDDNYSKQTEYESYKKKYVRI